MTHYVIIRTESYVLRIKSEISLFRIRFILKILW